MKVAAFPGLAQPTDGSGFIIGSQRSFDRAVTGQRL